jgi:hypothetical protein
MPRPGLWIGLVPRHVTAFSRGLGRSLSRRRAGTGPWPPDAERAVRSLRRAIACRSRSPARKRLSPMATNFEPRMNSPYLKLGRGRTPEAGTARGRRAKRLRVSTEKKPRAGRRASPAPDETSRTALEARKNTATTADNGAHRSLHSPDGEATPTPEPATAGLTPRDAFARPSYPTLPARWVRRVPAPPANPS